jgi:DHA3 family macrolide efflux protein-like MFS transporter
MATQFSVADTKSWKAPFFTIWGGQALSIMGSQLVQFALIWYLTVLTNSASVLATASLAGMLPGVILGPLAGTVVDRGNRRIIMLLADGLVALVTVGLALYFLLNRVEIWHIYAVIFIRSLAGSVHTTAMNASTSLMVPVEHLTRVQGLNQMLSGSLNVVAAPLGALLLEFMSLQGILAIDVITALLAILPLCFLAVPQPEQENKQLQSTLGRDFKAGIKFLISRPGLLIISLMSVGINFTIIPAFSLLPLMVKEYFGGGAIQLGWMESVMGLGVIAGGALLGVWGGFRQKILTSLLGLTTMGAGTLILALAPASAFTLAIGGVLLVGIANPLTMGPFMAVIQSTVDPDMQARVFSLLWSIGSGMAPIGLLLAGPVTDRFGIQTWLFPSGVLCILMAVAGLLIPAVLQVESMSKVAVKERQSALQQTI